MLTLAILYPGIGVALAMVTLGLTCSRKVIDRVAYRLGWSTAYARLVWLGGTIIAWPIGLLVLTTGRLVLVDSKTGFAALPPGHGPGLADAPTHHAFRSSPEGRRYPPSVALPPLSSRNWSIER